jgi:hypothetical protein
VDVLDLALVADGLDDRIAPSGAEPARAANDRDPVLGPLKVDVAGELEPTSTPPDERDLALATDGGDKVHALS